MNKKLIVIITLTAIAGAAVGQVARPYIKFQELIHAEQPTPPPGYIAFWELRHSEGRVCTGYTSTSPSGVVTHSPVSCVLQVVSPTYK